MESATQTRSKGSLSLFGALSETGREADKDVYIWSQGLAFHYRNLLEALNGREGVRKRLLEELWSEVARKAPEAIKETLGLREPVDVERMGIVLSQVLTDAEHPAINNSGRDVKESLLNWVRLFALVDFYVYLKLERHIGTKEGFPMYMGLWESFALSALEATKKAVGISKPEDVDMNKLGRLSTLYWETIACPYKVTKHSDEVHEAEIQCCPYWENMREILGEDVARSMTLKCEAAVSTNYYEAILKALGVFDRYSFTMDKFQCCGDNVCRIRFEKREA